MRSGLLGGLLVGILGVLVPPTMFWGEYEIQTLADPIHRPLPHIWPPGGIHGLEPFLGGHYTAGEPAPLMRRQQGSESADQVCTQTLFL